MLIYALGILGQITRFMGAIRSGHPAAYLGIFLRALAPFTRPLEKILSSHILKNGQGDQGEIPSCLMIVSPPRSGSTIIYQVLVRAIPSVYISNFHILFPGNASSYLLKKNLFGKKLTRFSNYYGYTSSFRDVYEGNEIVEALFCDDADERLIRERFRRFVRRMQASRERPLIFKNVRAYPHIFRLHQAVPEITFLRIQRDTEQVVQSVVRAYYELGTFHPIPQSLMNCQINDPVEFAVRQILEIERVIDMQMGKIPGDKWIEWRYEDFCVNTWPTIEDLAENYLEIHPSYLRRDVISEPLKVSKRPKVSIDEANRISMLLQQKAGLTTHNQL